MLKLLVFLVAMPADTNLAQLIKKVGEMEHAISGEN